MNTTAKYFKYLNKNYHIAAPSYSKNPLVMDKDEKNNHLYNIVDHLCQRGVEFRVALIIVKEWYINAVEIFISESNDINVAWVKEYKEARKSNT